MKIKVNIIKNNNRIREAGIDFISTKVEVILGFKK
jgi:hypothetical protein